MPRITDFEGRYLRTVIFDLFDGENLQLNKAKIIIACSFWMIRWILQIFILKCNIIFKECVLTKSIYKKHHQFSKVLIKKKKNSFGGKKRNCWKDKKEIKVCKRNFISWRLCDNFSRDFTFSAPKKYSLGTGINLSVLINNERKNKEKWI